MKAWRELQEKVCVLEMRDRRLREDLPDLLDHRFKASDTMEVVEFRMDAITARNKNVCSKYSFSKDQLSHMHTLLECS